MTPVKVRNIIIGEGIPKICVPIVGVTSQEILAQAHSLLNVPVDVVEWRVDWFEGFSDLPQVLEVLRNLRGLLCDLPILMTFRTLKEGGEKAISQEDYLKLNLAAAQSGYVDLIDVELFMEDHVVSRIIQQAHNCGVKVIASNHDFQKTPPKKEILSRLCKMQSLGADISKIAVMPRDRKDVLTLLSATEEMAQKYATGPIITMSMSGMGVISRLSGEIFGSALTFGAVQKTSAPGQIPVADLRSSLELLHQNLSLPSSN